jgi:hypothetical protein
VHLAALTFTTKPNPLGPGYRRMMLYNEEEVKQLAHEKHGGAKGLEAAKQKGKERSKQLKAPPGPTKRKSAKEAAATQSSIPEEYDSPGVAELRPLLAERVPASEEEDEQDADELQAVPDHGGDVLYWMQSALRAERAAEEAAAVAAAAKTAAAVKKEASDNKAGEGVDLQDTSSWAEGALEHGLLEDDQGIATLVTGIPWLDQGVKRADPGCLQCSLCRCSA